MSTLVIIGTGGTGGHVFPAQALCEYIFQDIQERNFDLESFKLRCGDFTGCASGNFDSSGGDLNKNYSERCNLKGICLNKDDLDADLDTDVHFVLDKKGYQFLKNFLDDFSLSDFSNSSMKSGFSGFPSSDKNDVNEKCHLSYEDKENDKGNTRSKSNLTYKIVRSCGLKKGVFNFIKFGFVMSWGTIQSVFSVLKILHNYKKIYKKNYDEVSCIGFGGYSSFPPVIACKLLSFLKIVKCGGGEKNRSSENTRIIGRNERNGRSGANSRGFSKGVKIFLHQSDVVMGKANRFLSRFANKVFLGLVSEKMNCNVSDAASRHGDGKFLHVGIPVRNMFLKHSNGSKSSSLCNSKVSLNACGNGYRNDYEDGVCEDGLSRDGSADVEKCSGLRNSEFLQLFKALNNGEFLSGEDGCEGNSEESDGGACNSMTQSLKCNNLNSDGLESERFNSGKLDFEKLKSINILAIGGSQSAAMWSDVLPRVIELLPENMKEIVKITQQCGKMKISEVRKKYIDAGLKAENVEILDFIKDIASEMNEADVVFARSGASTIAECAFMNKPAIFVPYKFAAQNHQMKNAELVQKYCGGWIWSESWNDSRSEVENNDNDSVVCVDAAEKSGRNLDCRQKLNNKLANAVVNTEKEAKILSLVNFLICFAKMLSKSRSVSVNLNEMLPRDAARRIMYYMRNC